MRSTGCFPYLLSFSATGGRECSVGVGALQRIGKIRLVVPAPCHSSAVGNSASLQGSLAERPHAIRLRGCLKIAGGQRIAMTGISPDMVI